MKNPLYLLNEMVASLSHRVYSGFASVYSRFKIYAFEPPFENLTVDESKVNYFLPRAILKGSIVADPKGNKYGKDYILSSAFAAPIINAPTAVIFTNPPSVTIAGEDEGPQSTDFESTMQQYYMEKQKQIVAAVKKSQTEGDAYLYIKDTFDADLVLLKPEYVNKTVDPEDYTNVLGFEVTSKVKRAEGTEVTSVKTKTIFRKVFPYRVVIQYQDESQVDKVIEIDGREVSIPIMKEELYLEQIATVDDYADLFNVQRFSEERPLPIIHFAFGEEPQSIYGESVYRNLYIYFLNYHRVLDTMLKNVLFNLSAFPYIKGIDNVENFKKNNGERQANGDYRFKLSPRNLIFGGKDFEIKHVEAPDVTSSAREALKVLFYLIVQASEVPEFFFGARMNASDASVKEQLPILINKGNDYQTMFSEAMKTLFETVIYYKSRNGDFTVSPEFDFDFNWGHVSLDNIDEVTKLVDKLDEFGLVTDETKAKILGLAKYVSDLKREVVLAKTENENRSLALDQRLFNPEAVEGEEIEDDDEEL